MHRTITMPLQPPVRRKRRLKAELPEHGPAAGVTAPGAALEAGRFPVVQAVTLVERYASIDVARGFAIFLMILSHCVVGLVPFDTLTGFQLIPVHLITKFSSTLFILVFGASLAIIYAQQALRPDWRERRLKLVMRGLEILVWYKVLTFVQMFQTYDRAIILEAILFMRFPDFVEVLGFYGIFLLWFPFAMPRFVKLSVPAQLACAFALAAAGAYLNVIWDAGRWTPLKAILVEHDGLFTFGQFQRGALVLFGMVVGRALIENTNSRRQLTVFGFGLASLAVFFYRAQGNVEGALLNVASNIGKHPPSLEFMSFSLGGALVLLAAAMYVKSRVPIWLELFAVLGRKSLQAFVFHIFVIFVLYRYLLDLRHQVSYATALGLALSTVLLTVLWVLALEFKTKTSRSRSSPRLNPEKAAWGGGL
ncbi:MAG TPA: acyltransferase family protein [Bdellovibrionales bacterium]|nr:acyltransferase family protein [Bdellovibrionales bacterium]